MTDLYDQLYEEFLAEEEIDDLSDTDELDDVDELDDLDDLSDEAPDDIPNGDLPNANIVRHERIEPEIRIILIPNENSLPKATEESRRLAEYFRYRSNDLHYGDILSTIKNDGLEQPRLDLTSIISRWFPKKKARWISLKCIGASNYCVSSDGDVCHLIMRRLLELGNRRYATCHIVLDNGKSIRMPVHNLITTAFWEYPQLSKMTVDHRNQNPKDNHYLNLSWESKDIQRFNQRKRVCKIIPVNQIDPVDGKVVKEWNNTYEVADHFEVCYQRINQAIRKNETFRGSLWEYHEPLLNGEEFRPVLINGLEGYFVSNKGRCLLRNGHITAGYLHYSGYRGVTWNNNLIGNKKYWIHILVAMFWLQRDCPTKNIVNHKDHIRDNNVVDNLEWTTMSGNNKHANRPKRRVSYVDGNGQRHEFSSIAEASNITKIAVPTIVRECQKSQGGKVARFSYIDEHVAKNPGGGTPVVQCDLISSQPLFVWESASCAAMYTGVERGSITKTINGKSPSGGGFLWRQPKIFEAPGDVTTIPDMSKLKSKGGVFKREGIVEIRQEYCDVVAINIYKSVNEATRILGIRKEIITDIAKFRRNGHVNVNDENVIHWFLYKSDYDKRVKNNEQLIQEIEIRDDSFRSIVILTLEGNFVIECSSATEASAFIRANDTTIRKSSIRTGAVIDVAKGYGYKIATHRFAFADDYYRNPQSYKENLHMSVLKAIKNARG